MNAAERAGLVLINDASAFMPARVRALVPELTKLAGMILDGDPIPADYLQLLLDIGQADIQGQVAAKGG